MIKNWVKYKFDFIEYEEYVSLINKYNKLRSKNIDLQSENMRLHLQLKKYKRKRNSKGQFISG